jgi:hypothetical protein
MTSRLLGVKRALENDLMTTDWPDDRSRARWMSAVLRGGASARGGGGGGHQPQASQPSASPQRRLHEAARRCAALQTCKRALGVGSQGPPAGRLGGWVGGGGGCRRGRTCRGA